MPGKGMATGFSFSKKEFKKKDEANNLGRGDFSV